MSAGWLAPDHPQRPWYGGRRAAPEERYDVAVVGAGIAGLVLGSLLARAGLSVLVAEQHYLAGGYCSTFRRRGYTFDAASHFYPLLGNPETLTGRLLRELGVDTRWVRMDPVDRFHLPDGSTFEVPADFATYLDRLKRAFPHEAAAIDAFFEEARRVHYLGLLYHFRGRDSSLLDPWRGQTLREALDRHFRDERLRLVLSADVAHWGSPPERTSYVFDAMLRLSYFQGNYYPVGGSQAFADDLARRFEELGGHLALRTSVQRIVVEGGRVRGIEIETGAPTARRRAVVGADVVVAAGDLRHACLRLLPPGLLDPAFRAGLRRMRPSMPCALVHIGLRDVSHLLLREIAGYYWERWDADAVGRGGLRFKVFVPTLYDPRMAPPGGEVVILQRALEVDYDAVSDWAAHKALLEREALERLARLVPGLRRKVVVLETATAHTSWRYTLNEHGAMVGWEMSPDQLGPGRPDVQGPVEGLYFAGHWTRPGGGITPVIVSAMRVAERIAASRVAAPAAPRGAC